MENSNNKQIFAIDHLRAVAILTILFHHGLVYFSYKERFGTILTLAESTWLRAQNVFDALIIEGHSAVALFAIISSFALTLGSYKKKIIYKNYLINRVLRIYPLFIFLLFIASYSFPVSFSFLSFLQTLIGFGNINGRLLLGSFSPMFWFVAIALQFYLVFPFLMTSLERSGIKYLIGLISVFIIFRIIAYFDGSNIRELSYWTIIGRMDQFIVGMIAAVYYTENKNKGKFWGIIFTFSLFLLFISLYIFNKLGGWPTESFYKVFWPTYEGLLWGIIFLSYMYVSNKMPISISKMLNVLSRISYSLFFIHFAIIVIMVKHDYLFEWGLGLEINALLNTLFIVVPIAVIISGFTYRYIEKPFLSLKIKN